MGGAGTLKCWICNIFWIWTCLFPSTADVHTAQYAQVGGFEKNDLLKGICFCFLVKRHCVCFRKATREDKFISDAKWVDTFLKPLKSGRRKMGGGKFSLRYNWHPQGPPYFSNRPCFAGFSWVKGQNYCYGFFTIKFFYSYIFPCQNWGSFKSISPLACVMLLLSPQMAKIVF